MYSLNRGTHDELHALFLEHSLHRLLHFAVHAGGHGIKKFNNGYIGAEAFVDRAKLEPDDTGPDHDHRFGDTWEREGAGRGHDGLLVDFNPRQGRRLGAGGDDDVLGLVGRFTDLDLTGGGDRRPALDPVDLVLFEEKLDALGVAVDHILFIGLHLRPIDLGGRGLEAHGRKIVLGHVQRMGRVQERLGGDTADVEAGAAERLAALNHSGFQPKLGAADRADITAGAGADDDDVI